MNEPELIGSIWEALPARAARKARTALADLRRNLEERQDPVSVALTRDTGASWDSDQMQALVTALLDEFAGNGRSKLVTGIFRTVVARWRQLTGHDCPSPAPTFTPKRTKHPRRYGLVRALRERNGYREALSKALRTIKKGKESEPDWLALAILSGLCHFQWLHKDAVLATVEACANPKTSFFLINQRVGLWFGLPLSGDPHAEQRITILDPLTAVLCLRTTPEEAIALLGADNLSAMSSANKKVVFNKLTQRLNAVIRQHVPQLKQATLDQMIRSCSVAAYYWLSPAVVSYLERKYVSGSTPPWVLARMEPSVQLLELREEIEHAAAAQAHSDPRSGGRESNEGHEAGDQYMPGWSPVFTAAMAGDKRAKIRTTFVRIQKDKSLPVVARLLAEFALELIADRGSKTIDPSTLRIYMRLLLRFVAPQIGGEDLVEMGTPELQDRYQDACDDFIDSPAGKAPSSRSRFIILLLRWHRFLVDRCDLEELEDFSPFVAGALPIDANIVSLEEFASYLSAIVEAADLSRHEKVAGVGASDLGIAGARRTEVLYLIPEDVDSEHVCIRGNRFRTTKTRNAIRTILLALLPRKAAHRLRALARRRKVQVRATLFGSERGGPIKEEAFIKKLLRILRESCQDSTLRFHSLRHTAATLATVALLCDDTTPIRELLPSLTKTLALLGNGSSLREAMYGTTEIHWCDLITVATQLGHGSAHATTMPHYAHGMFLVHFAAILGKKDLAPLARELALASGKSASAYRKAHGHESIEALLFHERFAEQIAAVRAKQAKQKPANRKHETECLRDPERAFACARRIIDEPAPIRQIAEELQMSIEDVEEVLEILAKVYEKAGDDGDASCNRAN
jgi:integrase